MIEVFGNLWEYEADAVVITTNGTIKTNGEAVMGRGCAKEAADSLPWLRMGLGLKLKHFGNHVFAWESALGMASWFFTFPVKIHWQERADLKLIEQSCIELVSIVNNHRGMMKGTIVIPRPGCGNGGLTWDEVGPICHQYFDRRFHVITFEQEKEGH